MSNVAVTEEGSFVALLSDRSGRFRILEANEEGGWEPVADWVQPPMEGFEHVQWIGLAVLDGSYAVSGIGQLEPRRGELASLPLFARVSRETGEYDLVVDHGRPDGGWLGDTVWFQDRLIGVGQAATDSQPWGPGIWASGDGLEWDPIEAPAEVQRVIYALGRIAASSEVVVTVGRNNYGEEPPWVLWSTDGLEWQAALLPMVDEGEEIRLSGVAHDGAEFVILGNAQKRDEPSHDARWRSEDGVRWEREEPLPSVFGDGNVEINGVWGNHGVLLLGGEGMHRASVLYCYDDPDTCQQPFVALWHRAEGTWRRIISPTGRRGGYTIATDGERFVATGNLDGRGAAWVWLPGAGDTQFYAEPFDTSPPHSELPLVRLDQVMEPDMTYAYPIRMGCWDMNVLGELNGVWWLLTEGPDRPAPEWPVYTNENAAPPSQVVYGTAELVAADRIEYSISGIGVVAVYQPAPPDYQPDYCL